MARKSKILIVDDHKENIVALAKLIENPDIAIYTAQNAHEALDKLVDSDFCLALLDVQMPEIDGFELARLIRGVKRHRHLPIIFVTAQQQSEFTTFEGYEAGAVDLLFKPLVPNIVRSKVRVFVELDQQKHMLEEQVKELEQLRKQADSANVAKSRFLANMSHEIRTPLAAVMGFAEMIADDQVFEDEKEELIQMIKKNGELLLHLIDDILDISRIESSKLELEETPFCLLDILREVKSTLTFKADEKGIGLEFSYPESCDKNYLSDPTRIKQVLLNVIGNAIKFTEKGFVSISIECNESETLEKSDSLTIRVKDQGVGMTDQQKQRIFSAFVQADSSTRRQFGGSGLGLLIAKSLAQALKGDVRLIDSELGKGSTFEITLNLLKATESQKTPDKKPADTPSSSSDHQFPGKQILIVDDYEENLILLQMYFRDTQAKLLTAKSGEEAVLKIKSNGTVDLVLMDIQMPGMDGYTATKELRDMGLEIPILAATAHAIRSERMKCLEVGCDDVLVKPLKKSKVLQAVADYLNR